MRSPPRQVLLPFRGCVPSAKIAMVDSFGWMLRQTMPNSLVCTKCLTIRLYSTKSSTIASAFRRANEETGPSTYVGAAFASHPRGGHDTTSQTRAALLGHLGRHVLRARRRDGPHLQPVPDEVRHVHLHTEVRILLGTPAIEDACRSGSGSGASAWPSGGRCLRCPRCRPSTR